MKNFIIIAVACLIFSFRASPSQAFWMWTPETSKWVNPKYAVKETPQEQLDYGRELFQAAEFKKAREEFLKLLKYYPKARQAAEAQFYVGLSLQSMGDPVKAFRAYQKVIDLYPFSELSAHVVQRQYEIGNALMEGKDEKNKFISAIAGNDYDVIEIYRAVINNAPYGPYAAPSQYKIGLYLQEKQLFREAREEFERTINDYPDSEWAKAAQFQIAMADAKRSPGPGYDQKTSKTAVEEFQDFVENNPGAELTGKAKKQINALREKEAENNYKIAHFYEKRRKFDAAKVYYSVIVDEYKNTIWAKKALEKLQALSKKIK